jgi:Fe2+ transport system protein FeoA
MKLIELDKNDVFKIVNFDDICDNMKTRFNSMGIDKNSMGQLLHKGFFGPIDIEFDNRKIAIGRKMAKKIEVKKYSCPLFNETN